MLLTLLIDKKNPSQTYTTKKPKAMKQTKTEKRAISL